MALSATRKALGCIAASALLAFACQPVDEEGGASGDALSQKGDPKAGWDYLVNGGYIQSGFPLSVFNVANFLGQTNMAPDWEEKHLEGRNAANDGLPYTFTHYRSQRGANLVVTNCLQCHAGHLNGKLVVGLGATDVDFSHDLGADLQKADFLARALLVGEDQREWEKLLARVRDIGGYNVLTTRGPAIANMLMPAIVAHQDPLTLKWQSKTAFELPPPFELPVDVPPWWNLKKKDAMFYVGSGKGDFTKHMMLASAFGIDDVNHAREINSHFKDIKAFIETIQPPAYPFPLDTAKASRGAKVFEGSCAGCHGTSGGAYPNRFVSIDTIKTDRLLIDQVMLRPQALAWHEKSFFGEGAPLEHKEGYVAPPLDGVWATAPYLHNGSVPTLHALLDSRLRPKYWRRTFRSTDYDPREVGWKHTVENRGKDGFDGDERVNLYDTTLPGFGNGGHTFGDQLSDAQRDDLLEYIKTL